MRAIWNWPKNLSEDLRWLMQLEAELKSKTQALEDEVHDLTARVSLLAEELEAQVSLGVGVSPESQTDLIIVSTLGGGHVQILSLRFRSLVELGNFVREVMDQYGIREESIVWDAPDPIRDRLMASVSCRRV